MTFATVRAAIAAQLRNDTEWSVFAFPPPVPQPLSVVLEPDDPYIVSTNGKSSLYAMLRLRARIYVPLMDNEGNLEQLERLATLVRLAIVDATQNVGALSQPQALDTDTGALLTAYFPFETLAEWATE